MEKEYEILELSYLREGFGEELEPELLLLSISQIPDFVSELNKIKQSRNYLKQHSMYYKLRGILIINASNNTYVATEIRKYEIIDYIRKANNLREFKNIYKSLYDLLYRCMCPYFYLNHKDNLIVKINSNRDEFFKLTEKLPETFYN